MRGLDNANAGQEMLDAMRFYYDFIRPHQALKGHTPAEVAGINLNPALGIRANKIEIIHDNCSVKIKPKEWIDKKTWREINDILRVQDFKWFGDGKESCWFRMAENTNAQASSLNES